MQNFSYGNKTQHLSTSNETFTHELFRSTRTASPPNQDTMTFFDNNGKRVNYGFGHPAFAGVFGKRSLTPSQKPVTTTVKAATSSSTSSADQALAQLQNSLATESQRKTENT